VVRATAAGRAPFEQTVELAAGDTAIVHIPELSALAGPVDESAAPPPPPPPRAQPSPTHRPTQSAIGQSVLAGSRRDTARLADAAPWLLAFGGLTITVGGVFGARAIVDGRAIREACPDRSCTSDGTWERAQALNDRARLEARAANIAIPVGAAVLAVGTYLLLRGSSKASGASQAADSSSLRWTW
jgi:hypothetical protein